MDTTPTDPRQIAYAERRRQWTDFVAAAAERCPYYGPFKAPKREEVPDEDTRAKVADVAPVGDVFQPEPADTREALAQALARIEQEDGEDEAPPAP